jgi:hypothetical protein
MEIFGEAAVRLETAALAVKLTVKEETGLIYQ